MIREGEDAQKGGRATGQNKLVFVHEEWAGKAKTVGVPVDEIRWPPKQPSGRISSALVWVTFCCQWETCETFSSKMNQAQHTCHFHLFPGGYLQSAIGCFTVLQLAIISLISLINFVGRCQCIQIRCLHGLTFVSWLNSVSLLDHSLLYSLFHSLKRPNFSVSGGFGKVPSLPVYPDFIPTV